MRYAIVILMALMTAASVDACPFCAPDSLGREQKALPQVEYTIHDWLPRHSQAYYKWLGGRAKGALKRGDHSMSHYSDLAVAYDALGETDLAIKVIEAKAKRWPDVYQTEVLWGTLLVHKGDAAAGLVHLRRAHEIDPQMYGGRVEYQGLMVEHSILQAEIAADEADGRMDFARFLMAKRKVGPDSKEWKAERARAIQHLTSLMQNGHHNSTPYIIALGDLLMAGEGDEKYRSLAVIAYIRAGDVATTDAQRDYAKLLATHAALDVKIHEKAEGDDHYLRVLEQYSMRVQYMAELAAKEQAKVAANEATWIAAGEDVEARYRATYMQPAK